jgi:trehalose-6-phosphate synthase
MHMPEREQERRMRSMRNQVKNYDVARWAGEFIACLRDECQ